MSDTSLQNEPNPKLTVTPVIPAEDKPAKVSAKQKRGWALAVLMLLGFIVLGGGEGYLWHLIQGQSADATELAVLRAQLTDLQAATARAQPAPDSVTVQADLTQKYAALAAQVSAIQAQVASDHGGLSMLQANAVDLGKVSARMARLNALGNARMALESGQPVGEIANAPPALAAFATTAPPTEASLRLSFAAAASAANAASVSTNGKGGAWAKFVARLQSVVIVDKGSEALMGPPSAGVLAEAQTALDAGDLAGAVAQIETLNQSTQAAMGPWLTQAKALLAARTALLSMAAQP